MHDSPSSSPASIMSALREHTQPAHHEIEAVSPITALAAGQGGMAEYTAILKASLSYYRPFERQLMERAAPEIRQFMQSRLKTDLLTRDLAKLGISQEEIAAIADYDIPSMDTPEAVLGALYTLEGSTMGGKVISKSLKTHFGWDMLNAEHFLDPYGNQVRARWKEFGDFVQAQFESYHLDGNAIIRAANETFAAYQACLAAPPKNWASGVKPARKTEDLCR